MSSEAAEAAQIAEQPPVVEAIPAKEADAFQTAFEQALEPGSQTLSFQQLPEFLEKLQLQAQPEQLQAALKHLGDVEKPLTKDDTAVLCQLLANPSGSLSVQPSLQASNSTATMHHSLSKKRMGYMESGKLQTDEAVLMYLQRLDSHRKMCELTGRYAEAGAAASRIQELKTAQALRLRGDLATVQANELGQLQDRFQQETKSFDAEWRDKVAAYEAGVAAQLTALRAAHEAQTADFLLQCELNRPAKPHHSAEYLNNRKIEERLVKQGQYRKAHELKVAADAMYHTELASTHVAWDSEVEIKKTKVASKQQSELEALLQRAARGRDELELRRLDEAEKRGNRFRCVVQDLDSMHRLEVVHLENFLEGQAQAGKYVPLRDSTFRRKRELLGL